MTKTRIFSFLLIPVIIYLAYLLIWGIKGDIDLAAAIKASEERVVERLKEIRKAEKLYISMYGDYTASWDTLVNFIKNDTFYITEKTEIIEPRTPDDPLYYTRTDSIRIEIDTLDFQMVHENLFPKEEYPSFNPDSIMYIPGQTDKKFDIFVDEIEKSGVVIDVIEVVDRYPLDPSRSEEDPSPKRWPLRFGSRNEVTTSGNWE